MEQVLKIADLASKFKKDRTTILRWIERGAFPNADLKETPLGSYWEIPASDLVDFKTPERISRKKKSEVGK